MDNKNTKSWKTSVHKWAYLKASIRFMLPPSKIYYIAHKDRAATVRERVIRGRLLRMGVLKDANNDNSPSNIDLNTGHI